MARLLVAFAARWQVLALWYSGDAERMERSLHPDLTKRIDFADSRGFERLEPISARGRHAQRAPHPSGSAKRSPFWTCLAKPPAGAWMPPIGSITCTWASSTGSGRWSMCDGSGGRRECEQLGRSGQRTAQARQKSLQLQHAIVHEHGHFQL